MKVRGGTMFLLWAAGRVSWLQVSKCGGALWGRGDKVSVQRVQNVCVDMHQRKVWVFSESWRCVPMSSRRRRCARMRPWRWLGTDINSISFSVFENVALVCGWSYVKHDAAWRCLAQAFWAGGQGGLCRRLYFLAVQLWSLMLLTLCQFEKPAFTKGVFFLKFVSRYDFFPDCFQANKTENIIPYDTKSRKFEAGY